MQNDYQNKNLEIWPSNLPSGITSLNLNNNKIPKVIIDIENLKTLKQLILSNNLIEEIPFKIGDLKQLNYLSLNNNKITNIPQEIKRLKKLKILHIANNKIMALPIGIGDLKELHNLDISGNPIEHLPDSIRFCENLKKFNIINTKLPKPPNHNKMSPQEVIKYILDNQKQPLPEIDLKQAYIFNNFSKTEIIEKFNNLEQNISEETDVELISFKNLNSFDIKAKVIIIIVGFDVHNDKELIFNIIEKCKNHEVPCRILYQKDVESINYVHSEKGVEYTKLRKTLENDFKFELNKFSNDSEFKNLVRNVLQQQLPKVRLRKLKLKNISHFDDITLNLDENLTCFLGENGSGKSSILRAISLAIIGTDIPKIKNNLSTRNLLKIESIIDGKTIYKDSGSIKLTYSIDSEEYTNEVLLTSEDEGRVIDIRNKGDFKLNTNEYNLKSLIIGFPQLRGEINKKEAINPYSQPHIDDLLPLIENKTDTRLDSFISWIANLYIEASKSGNEKENTKEFEIIKFVFEIISSIIGKSISFQDIQKVSPPIIIIKSENSENGIPLNLISQGFKVVIGWIGYFIQRKIEAFPLSSLYNSHEKSILLIDEIDSSIHPVWQNNLLSVLQDKFPNTQIICTTHSPLMITGLNKNQIIEIRQNGEELSAINSKFNTFVTNYNDILKYLFNTNEYIPKITIEELEYRLEKYNQNSKEYKEILSNIEQLKEDQAFTDDLAKYKQDLIDKREEFNRLIDQLSQKVVK